MLHHTRRWNRSHLEELHSAWLNGVGDARVGERLRRVGRLERARPRAAAGDDGRAAAARRAARDRRVDAARGARARTRGSSRSRWSDGETTLWALANRGEALRRARSASSTSSCRRGGIAAFVGSEGVDGRRRRRRDVPGARDGARRRRRSRGWRESPDGFVEVAARAARSRRRSAAARPGIYGEAPYVEEWKPLPPRLHDLVEVERDRSPRRVRDRACARWPAPAGAPLTGLTLAEARAYAAAAGARLPTEDEWQLAAEAGLLERAEPLVWNWTESEHSDGRTRFAILKGGSDWKAGGLGLVRRRRRAGPGVLAEAAARRPAPALVADRLPPGGRPAVNVVTLVSEQALEGIRSSRRRRSSPRRSPGCSSATTART